ncbi:MAG: 2-C-methyl-D-erythritol 4-phosphate cytidylyltransferase [Magnetococcales bacterium]|nr:2-C-methyl-D-erythritol 4-phosphate cytidylyltransferase [Magnetococcales bacterium]
MSPVSQPCAMLVVAAGRGSRFGGKIPKQYRPLGDMPLLLHTLRRLHSHPLITTITPIISADDGHWLPLMKPHLAALPKVTTPVYGGSERQMSVDNGLRALNLPENAWVGIHDGARPLVSLALLDRLFAGRAECDGVIAALPAADTLKKVDENGMIVATVDRTPIWQAQTPQIFQYGAILEAHRKARENNHLGTDDASLMERVGARVRVTVGDPLNQKITRPEDLAMAERLLKEENAS